MTHIYGIDMTSERGAVIYIFRHVYTNLYGHERISGILTFCKKYGVVFLTQY